MVKERGKVISRNAIITAAIVVSLIIYFAGLFSGLYANKVIKQNVQQDISLLKNYTDTSTVELKNMLLLQFYSDKLSDCKFSEMYVSHLHEQLYPYWEILPKRLEEYEKYNKITDEYVGLKREYFRLSLRIWLTAMNNYRKCNTTSFIPVLYFYSKDCETCIEQGKVLDKFNKEGIYAKKNIFVFPIDGYFEDDTIYLLEQYYNITKFPAVIVNDKVLQGGIIQAEDILKEI
jgi:hypothetical protein